MLAKLQIGGRSCERLHKQRYGNARTRRVTPGLQNFIDASILSGYIGGEGRCII